MVVLQNIPMHSLCEHHMLPFYGCVHVGYIPRGRIVGVSKLARLTDGFSRRLQVQERLTSQIADALIEGLKPIGCGVVIEAEHLCMTMRGIQRPGSRMITSAMRGTFRENAATRSEFLAIIHHRLNHE